LYRTSKAITEYIDEGQAYGKIKKVISITIAYFDLSQGQDYVYHGITEFKGLHDDDILNLSEPKMQIYQVGQVRKIHPEYWVIKAEKFDDAVQNKLDKRIYFLKMVRFKNIFQQKVYLKRKIN
jgi:hypothetical protein